MTSRHSCGGSGTGSWHRHGGRRDRCDRAEATRDLYAAGAVQAGDDDDYSQQPVHRCPAPGGVARGAGARQLLHLRSDCRPKTCCSGCCQRRSFRCWAAPGMGAQSSTVVIRGLSTQSISSWSGVAIAREAMAGALLGVLMMLLVAALLCGEERLVGLSVT